jgi:cell division septal protein FtsQ
MRNSARSFRRVYLRPVADFLRRAVFFTIITAALAALLLVLIFSSYFRIRDVEIARQGFNVDTAIIRNELLTFVGKNILFIPKSRIKEVIKKDFPEFKSVNVNKMLPGKILITLESYPIVANLRAYAILPELETRPQDFSELNKVIQELAGPEELPAEAPVKKEPANKSPFEDQKLTNAAFSLKPGNIPEEDLNGKEEPIEQKCLLNSIGQAIFDQEENLELITITIRGLSKAIADRERAIPENDMKYIFDAKEYFINALSLPIKAIEYLPVAREVHFKTEKGMVVWIAMERDYKTQIDKLNVIYEEAELNKEELSYIDLRVKEKIIYCKKNDVCDK